MFCFPNISWFTMMYLEIRPGFKISTRISATNSHLIECQETETFTQRLHSTAKRHLKIYSANWADESTWKFSSMALLLLFGGIE